MTNLTELDEMRMVADDGEHAVLDDLRRRAGITWECYGDDDEGGGHWTNHRDDDVCGICQRPRPEVRAG
jgi:hypothetical protein